MFGSSNSGSVSGWGSTGTTNAFAPSTVSQPNPVLGSGFATPSQLQPYGSSGQPAQPTAFSAANSAFGSPATSGFLSQQTQAPPQQSGGFGTSGFNTPAQPAASGWGSTPAQPTSTGWGSTPAQPASSGWGSTPAQPTTSGWGSTPTQPTTNTWGSTPAQPSTNAWGSTPTQPATSGGWMSASTQPASSTWGSTPAQPATGGWMSTPAQPAPGGSLFNSASPTLVPGASSVGSSAQPPTSGWLSSSATPAQQGPGTNYNASNTFLGGLSTPQTQPSTSFLSNVSMGGSINPSQSAQLGTSIKPWTKTKEKNGDRQKTMYYIAMSGMPEYENKSLEELRYEDVMNRPATNNPVGSNLGIAAAPPAIPGLTGQQPFSWNSQQSTPGFAQQSTPGFAQQSTPGFAQQSIPGFAQQSAPGFAQQSTPGFPGLQSTPGFSGLQSTTGFSQQSSPNFGFSTASSFGQSTNAAVGQETSSSFGFGTTAGFGGNQSGSLSGPFNLSGNGNAAGQGNGVGSSFGLNLGGTGASFPFNSNSTTQPGKFQFNAETNASLNFGTSTGTPFGNSGTQFGGTGNSLNQLVPSQQTPPQVLPSRRVVRGLTGYKGNWYENALGLPRPLHNYPDIYVPLRPPDALPDGYDPYGLTRVYKGPQTPVKPKVPPSALESLKNFEEKEQNEQKDQINRLRRFRHGMLVAPEGIEDTLKSSPSKTGLTSLDVPSTKGLQLHPKLPKGLQIPDAKDLFKERRMRTLLSNRSIEEDFHKEPLELKSSNSSVNSGIKVLPRPFALQKMSERDLKSVKLTVEGDGVLIEWQNIDLSSLSALELSKLDERMSQYVQKNENQQLDITLEGPFREFPALVSVKVTGDHDEAYFKNLSEQLGLKFKGFADGVWMFELNQT